MSERGGGVNFNSGMAYVMSQRKNVVTVAELFRTATLEPQGPVCWGEPVDENQNGVYAVSLTWNPIGTCEAVDVNYLPEREQARWVAGQPVLYVGCSSRPLSVRISEFYRHKYGKSAPHRGGQAVKLLTNCSLWVFWAPTARFSESEDLMISEFKAKTGKLPFANRKRGGGCGTRR